MAHHREGVAPHSGNMDVDVDMSFGSALAPYAGPSQVEVGPGLGSGSGWFGSFSTPEHVSPYVPVTQVIPSSFPSSPSFTMRSHQAPQGAFVSPSALPLDNPGHTSSSGVNAVASVTTEANACDSPSASANTTADIPASPAPSSVEAPRSRAPSLSHSLPLRFGAALEPELPVSANHTTTTTTTTPGRAFAPAPAPAPRNGNAVGFAFGLAGAASGEAKRGRFPAESGPPEPQSKSLSQTPAQSQAFSSRARKVSNAERVGFSWGMGQ
ncbi:hypothetical protein EHS25_008785 [Saitozyma podzolica]|uniref:Uncharacterized protein n=1 Tax=Saitozyma podzolica TaxID=1890683 RepID=A0A427YMU1_9TREE|nr:hypothetical protein EHS25_008785 [Saitozyma podzolica]